jgi:hypothetical protein
LRYGINCKQTEGQLRELKERTQNNDWENAEPIHNSRDGITLEEVGKILGTTRGRPQQIEAKATRKMRHPARSRRLRHLYLPERSAGKDDQMTSHWLSSGEIADRLNIGITVVDAILSRLVPVPSDDKTEYLLRYDPMRGYYLRARVVRGVRKLSIEIHANEVNRFAVLYGFKPDSVEERPSDEEEGGVWLSAREIAAHSGSPVCLIETILNNFIDVSVDEGGRHIVGGYDPVQKQIWEAKLYGADDGYCIRLRDNQLNRFVAEYGLKNPSSSVADEPPTQTPIRRQRVRRTGGSRQRGRRASNKGARADKL